MEYDNFAWSWTSIVLPINSPAVTHKIATSHCDFSQRLAVPANFCFLGQRPSCGSGCFGVSQGIVMGFALRSPTRRASTSDVTLALV